MSSPAANFILPPGEVLDMPRTTRLTESDSRDYAETTGRYRRDLFRFAKRKREREASDAE
jgi:hypothetical protein